MAQAMASMTGLRGSSQGALSGPVNRRAVISKASLNVRESAEGETVAQAGRRAMLSLVTTGMVSGAFVQAVLAAAKPIKVGGPPPLSGGLLLAVDAKPIKVRPPPPPSGGLPGTLNADQPRDLDLPLKERFYLQPLPPAEAAARAKESAQDIINLKPLIDKKAWPYVMNDLRLRASYLRYDLNTVISAKPKDEKKGLKDLTGKLFNTIDGLDHAAKIKSPQEAEKYYAETKSVLGDVLAKLG